MNEVKVNESINEEALALFTDPTNDRLLNLTLLAVTGRSTDKVYQFADKVSYLMLRSLCHYHRNVGPRECP